MCVLSREPSQPGSGQGGRFAESALSGGEAVSSLSGDARTEEPWPGLTIKAELCVSLRASLESSSPPTFHPERPALFVPNSQMESLRPREVT